MKGVKKSCELVGLSKDDVEMIAKELVVTRSLLSTHSIEL